MLRRAFQDLSEDSAGCGAELVGEAVLGLFLADLFGHDCGDAVWCDQLRLRPDRQIPLTVLGSRPPVRTRVPGKPVSPANA